MGYGRIRTGSKVISVSATNVDKAVWERNALSDFVEGNVHIPDFTSLSVGLGGGGMGTPFVLR